MLLRRLICSTAAAALFAGCATTGTTPRVVGERPQALDTTEASFWYQMDQMEADLRASGRLVEDPALTAYVSELICEIASEHCSAVRVYIADNPGFNAVMAPNGMMIVNTGLLLRVMSRDELAFVLGHEMAHFLENHALQQHQANRNANITGAVLGSVLAIGVAASGGMPIGQGYSGSAGSIGYALAAGGAFGYSRSLESDADQIGLGMIADAGMDPSAAPRIWSNMLDELEASEDDERARRESRRGLYRTHPIIQRRIDDLNSAITDMAPAEPRSDGYNTAIAPHIKDWLDAHIAMRDTGSSLFLIDRRIEGGAHLGVLHAGRARVLAARDEEGDAEAALEAYQIASQYEDMPADAHRGMAELYRQAGRSADAAEAYRHYLHLTPDARDRLLVERLIENLEGEVQ